MADILIDVEVKGNQKVVTAVKGVQDLQANVKRLSDAFKSGSLSVIQYEKGLTQLAANSGKSNKQLRDYANTLRQVERESKAAKTAQDQEREAVKAYTQARREATAANQRYDAELKQKAKSEEEAARAAAKHASDMEQIKNKYVPLYAASKQYERAIEELNQAYVQGALTQGQYLAAMENIDSQLANNRSAAVGNVKSMNAMGVAIQQTGYQVGDFLVQIQSGTNAFVAFGQQATQLVGVLPMFNPALVGISAALGIIIPLVTALGAAWMRTRDGTEANEGALFDWGKAADSAYEKAKNLKMELEATANGFRDVGQAALTMALEEAETNLAELQARGRGNQRVSEGAFEEIVNYNKELVRLARERLDLYNETRAVQEAEQAGLEAFSAQVSAYYEEQKRAAEVLADARDRIAQLNQEVELNEAILNYGRDSAEVEEIRRQHAMNVVEEYIKQNKLAGDIAQELRDSAAAAHDTSVAVSSINFSGAVSSAQELANWLGISLSKALALAAVTPQMADEDLLMSQSVIPDSRARAAQRDAIKNFERLEAAANRPSRAGSSGSGGGGVNPIEQAEEYLQKLQREADFKRTLIGLSDEQVAQETRREQLLNQLNGYEEGLGNQYSERIEQIIQTEAETRKLIEAEQKREQMMRMIESNIESAFMSIVNGSKSVEDAFKSMLRNILLEIYQQQVAKPAASGIADLIGNFIGGFKGSFSIGRGKSAPASSLRPKARSFEGGGFTGYGPRSGGLDGRGGMLAMVHPNETVVDHTKGQKVGGNVTVVQNFSFQANGDESVKRIIGQSMPQIAQYTSKTIVDQRRKGGSMKAAFRG